MAATVAGWITYAGARGLTVVNDADSAAALVRAGDYIQYRYIANLLPGYDATLPVVEPATYEAAALELSKPGFFSKTYTASEQKALVGLGSLKWQIVGDASGVYAAMPSSSLIDAMFAPYLFSRDQNSVFLKVVG